MSLFNRILSIAIFMVILNVVSAIYAQYLPLGWSGGTMYEELKQKAELNISEVSNPNPAGFVVDVTKALTYLSDLRSYLLGGNNIAALLGLTGDTASMVATAIDTVEFLLYIVLLFLFFSGRG